MHVGMVYLHQRRRLAGLGVWVTALLLTVAAPSGKTQAQISTLSPHGPAPPPGRSQAASGCCRPESPPSEKSNPSLSAEPTTSSLPPTRLFDPAVSQTKFRIERLMTLLRDNRHEGWVRTAYPDPKTGRPLIGGGFSLDLSATQHMQRNPLNPNAFIEPSSAELWQEAGLDLEELNVILDQYYQRQALWGKATFRQKIRAHELPPDISEEEAMRLLRISTLQAIHNARAYCVDFDEMNASQQMALSQLVFQMGVNLEEFVAFLSVINGFAGESHTGQNASVVRNFNWKAVQGTLVHSDWARRYAIRAISVIAMFDPNYDRGPNRAEDRVRVWIHPPPSHHHRKSRREFVRNPRGRVGFTRWHAYNRPKANPSTAPTVWRHD